MNLSYTRVLFVFFREKLYFDKNTGDYRTNTENEVFMICCLFSGNCKEGKEKVTTELLRLSPFGRDEATRTPDPYVPNVVRYQLRYIPNAIESGCKGSDFF